MGTLLPVVTQTPERGSQTAATYSTELKKQTNKQTKNTAEQMIFQLYFLWTERFPFFSFTKQAEAETKKLLPDGFNSMTILIIALVTFNVIIYFNHLKPIYNRHESILSMK